MLPFGTKNVHEKEIPEMKEVYPDGLHGELAAYPAHPRRYRSAHRNAG